MVIFFNFQKHSLSQKGAYSHIATHKWLNKQWCITHGPPVGNGKV